MADKKVKIYNLQPNSVYLHDAWWLQGDGPMVPPKEAELRCDPKREGHIWSLEKPKTEGKKTSGKAGE